MKNEYGLTPQVEHFARSLAEGKSQADAYRDAYPTSRKWAGKTVHVKASMLAAEEKVQRRVRMLQGVLADRSVLKAELVLATLTRIVSATPARLIRETVDDDGKKRATVLMPHELDPDTAQAVTSFEIDDLGKIKYRFADKNPALATAARVLGMFEKDNSQQASAIMAMWRDITAGGGQVVRPDPAAALPDGGEDDERDA